MRFLLKLLLAVVLTPLSFVVACGIIRALIAVPCIGVPPLLVGIAIFAVWASPTTRMTSDEFILYNQAKDLLRQK